MKSNNGLNIELERDVFLGGEVVKGRVIYRRHVLLRVTGAEIKLKGVLKTIGDEQIVFDENMVLYDENPGLLAITEDETEERNSKKIHFLENKNKEMKKYKCEDSGLEIIEKNDSHTQGAGLKNHMILTLYTKSSGNNSLRSCERSFNFKFSLPTNIPPSFETSLCQVHYTIEARLTTPKNKTLIYSKTFFISTASSEYNLDEYTKVVKRTKSAPPGWFQCFFGGGNVSLRIQLDKTLFTIGDAMKIQCSVQNNSFEHILFYCQLLQMFSYKKKNSTNKSVEIFCEHPITLIKKLKSNEFCFFFTLGSSQLSTLPPAAPPTMSTDLISLRYELKAGLLVETAKRDVTIRIPIIVTWDNIHECGHFLSF